MAPAGRLSDGNLAVFLVIWLAPLALPAALERASAQPPGSVIVQQLSYLVGLTQRHHSRRRLPGLRGAVVSVCH